MKKNFNGFAYWAGQEQGVVQLPDQEPPFRFRGTPPPHDQASDAAPKRWGRIDQIHQPEAKGLNPIFNEKQGRHHGNT